MKEKTFPELDEHCKKIAVTLLMADRKVRFNELHDILKGMRMKKLSKPTLSEHLKHLTEKKLVLRKVEGVQNVTYRINSARFRNSQEILRYQKIIDKRLQEEQGKFNSLPASEQVSHVYFLRALKDMQILKAQIFSYLEPSQLFERSFQVALFKESFLHYEKWLLENCRKDSEFTKEVLKKIEEDTDKFMSVLFDNYAEIKRNSDKLKGELHGEI